MKKCLKPPPGFVASKTQHMFGGKWLAVVEKKETTTQKFVSKIVWKLPPIFGMKIETCILKNISFSKISTKRSIFKRTKGSQRGASGTSTGATVATCTETRRKRLEWNCKSLASSAILVTLRLHGMSWGVKTTCFTAPGVSLGGSGVSIGGVRSLRALQTCFDPNLP